MMKKLILSIFTLLPTLAIAHPGHESTSFATGLVSGALHPLLGLDHLLALLAVGLLSARLVGKQRFAVPVAFIAVMAIGFYAAHAGLHGIAAGTIELAISASIIAAAGFVVVSLLLKRDHALSNLAAWGMTGFAIFHGLAHGLEVPASAALNGFALGFLVMSTALIALAYSAVNFVALQKMKKVKA